MTENDITSAICCVALNEEEYIAEWIDYHLLLGFDAIHIYDNSEDNSLRGYDGANEGRVRIIHFPGKVMQSASYNHFLGANKGKFTFAAFIDCDEFIVLKTSPSINRYLQDKEIDAGLAINWSMFGSNFQESRGPGGVLRRFVRRAEVLDDGIKCIVRLDRIEEYSHPHCPTKKRGIIRDAKGREIKEWTNPEGDDSEIVIFHYWTKSKEEFLEKVARGRADMEGKRPQPELAFNEFNLRANQVLDETALNFFASHRTDLPAPSELPHPTSSATTDPVDPPFSRREMQMLELLVFAAKKVGRMPLWDLQEVLSAAERGEQNPEKAVVANLRTWLHDQNNRNNELEKAMLAEHAHNDQLQTWIRSLQAEITQLQLRRDELQAETEQLHSLVRQLQAKIEEQVSERDYLQRVVQSASEWQKRFWIVRIFRKWKVPEREQAVQDVDSVEKSL